MKIRKRATRLDQLEARIAALESVEHGQPMPDDVMAFVVQEQYQDEELEETMARLAQQYADINNRRELGIPEPGDMARLSALERIVRWIR